MVCALGGTFPWQGVGGSVWCVLWALPFDIACSLLCYCHCCFFLCTCSCALMLVWQHFKLTANWVFGSA